MRIWLDKEQLPCGCLIGNAVENGERQFMMVPCSLDCENYRAAVSETKAQGKPVRFERAR